jgi:uncharacterized surface protein with fasciclin (FAS1) repeats
MTQTKWRRFFAAVMVTALLVTSVAPTAFAAEQSAPAYQTVRASEVSGMIPGGQFAKIWLGVTPENPGTVNVTAVWDRANPEQNGLGFFVLNEANLSAVVAGQNLRDNNVAAGSTNFFLNGPDNQQGASFRATGGAYTVIVYNDSASDANFTLSVDNGVLVDDSGQVKAAGAAAEATTEGAEEAATTEAAATEAATVEATADVTATATVAATPAATTAATTAVVTSGPFRGATVAGELVEQYAQHYLGLEPTQRDGDITLRLTFDPRDNQELARRLGFWVLDDQGFRRYQAGENAGDVAVAAGNRVSTPGEDNVRSASFNASGLGSYTVIVYNNSRVPATYELSVSGGVLIDDAQQTITARESVTGTVTTTTTGATTTAATSTTTTTATTTAGTGREGEPGGTYTVQTGDTLALIARDIYGDFRLYEDLCAFNNIADCNVIEVGQVINLPTNEEIGATGTTATTTTAAATPAATVAATTATTATTTTTATTATTGTTTTATRPVTTTAPVTSTGTTTGTTATTATTGSTAAGTIAEVAASNPNFSILSQALEATGLDATLASGEYTVFAPTDAAFNDLLATTKLTADELLLADELVDILKYHVLNGEVLAEDVTNGMKATTLQGKQVTFEVKDGSVYINGAKVTISDIPASNGVIHAISAVILPPAQ